MIKRMIVPLILGIGGIAILVSLGTWQLRRLEWKQDVLSEIEARIAAPPVPFAQAEGPYAPVYATGILGGPELHVLVSRKQIGAGYRIIQALETEQGRIMVDRGFVPVAQVDTPRPTQTLSVTGNLHAPQDRNSSTPENDVEANIWFARDVTQMAEVLGTQPVLLIARSDTGQGVDPMPVATESIPNDHLQYAMTWFSLAVVWLGMTLYLLWRIRAKTV